MAIERELSLMETHTRNLLDTVKRGRATDAPLQELESETQRKKLLIAELDALDRQAIAGTLDGKGLERELPTRAADVRGLLGRHVGTTRQILWKFMVGRLACEPFDEGGERGYRFTGQGSYQPLLPGKLVPPCVVTPAGFARSWMLKFRRLLLVA
jgi:hypothetical protein